MTRQDSPIQKGNAQPAISVSAVLSPRPQHKGPMLTCVPQARTVHRVPQTRLPAHKERSTQHYNYTLRTSVAIVQREIIVIQQVRDFDKYFFFTLLLHT